MIQDIQIPNHFRDLPSNVALQNNDNKVATGIKKKLHVDTRRQLRSGKIKPSEASLKIQQAEAWHHHIVSARAGYWNLSCRLSLTAPYNGTRVDDRDDLMDDRFSSGDGIVGTLMDNFSAAINCETKYVGTFEKKLGHLHFHVLVHIEHPEITNSRIKLAEKLLTQLVMNDRDFRNDLRIERIPVDSHAYQRCSEYLTGAGEVFIGKGAPLIQVS